MLITHVRPTELWGKKVYDTNGHLLGEVVAIGSRRGVVRKVVVQRVPAAGIVSLVAPAGVDAEVVTLPAPASSGRPRLRVVN